MDLLGAFKSAFRRYLAYRAVLAELASYNDRELNELGIGRGDVSRLARTEASRRTA
jgi:uncharacterized protein YjiS (DUF1127 family)